MTTAQTPADGDMDAELAQLLREQEQFLNQKKAPSAQLFRCSSGPKVPTSNSSTKASKSATEEDPPMLKSVIERHVTTTPVGQQHFVLDRNSSGFPLVQRRGAGPSLFGRRRREAASGKQEQLQKPLDQESSEIDAMNRTALQEMSPYEIEEAQQELLRSLDPKLIEKFKNRRKKNDNKTINESESQIVDAEKKKMVIRSVIKYEKDAEDEKNQIQKEERIKSLAAVKTKEELRK